jgi:hypothetical protein
MKLNVKACALAGAVLWGLGLLLLTWWLILFGEAPEETAALISQVYIGYSVTVGGSFIGFFWGFADGLFGGFFFAWLYNRLAERFIDVEHELTH